MKTILYVNHYAKVTKNKSGKTVNTYVATKETQVNRVIRSDLEMVKDKLSQEFGTDVSQLKFCTKKEYETRVKEDREPLGYISIYFVIHCKENDEDIAGYGKICMDFNRELTEELVPIICRQACIDCSNLYQEKGYQVTDVDCCTKEEYESNNQNAEKLLEYEWQDNPERKHHERNYD